MQKYVLLFLNELYRTVFAFHFKLASQNSFHCFLFVILVRRGKMRRTGKLKHFLTLVGLSRPPSSSGSAGTVTAGP